MWEWHADVVCVCVWGGGVRGTEGFRVNGGCEAPEHAGGEVGGEDGGVGQVEED